MNFFRKFQTAATSAAQRLGGYAYQAGHAVYQAGQAAGQALVSAGATVVDNLASRLVSPADEPTAEDRRQEQEYVAQFGKIIGVKYKSEDKFAKNLLELKSTLRGYGGFTITNNYEKADYIVYKNSLGNFVFRKTDGECVEKLLTGKETPDSDSDRELVRAFELNAPVALVSFSKADFDRSLVQGEGSFFKHFLDEEFPYSLMKYGIYKKSEFKTKFNTIDYKNCFHQAIKNSNLVSEESVDELARSLCYYVTPAKSINSASKILKKPICLTKEDKSGRGNCKYFYKGRQARRKEIPEDEDIIKICLIDNHYFVHEETAIRRVDIFDIENPKTRDYKKMSSRELVLKLLESDWLYPIDVASIQKTIFARNTSESVMTELSPETVLNHQNPFEEKRKWEKVQIPFVADFETFQNVNQRHIACMLSFSSLDEFSPKTFYGQKSGSAFLNYITTDYLYTQQFDKLLEKHCAQYKLVRVKNYLKKVLNPALPNPLGTPLSQIPNLVIYFHNLGYDIKFLFEYFQNVDFCIEKSSSNCIILKTTYNGINLEFRDSLALIPAALSKFNKMFNLEDSKWKDFDYDAITKALQPEYTAYKELPEITDQPANLKESGKRYCVDGKFYIKDYLKDYCEQDLNVMIQGLKSFDKSLKEDFNQSILDKLTVSSIAIQHCKDSGVLDGVNSFNGPLRHYVQQAVVGGRVCIRNNKPCEYDGDVYDLDVTSLYPTAMSKIGLPMGKIEQVNPSDVWNYKDFVVTIKVTKVGKKRAIPCLSVLNEDQTRNWTNDLVGKTLVLDRISLEDGIKYHKIKYEILYALAFTENVQNFKINDEMIRMFSTRKDLKQKKNSKEQIYKLIMNSIYGKFIEKPHPEKTKFVSNKDFHSWLKFNSGSVLEFERVNDHFWRTKTAVGIVEHETWPYIGAKILSMSKRLVNKVLYKKLPNKTYVDDHTFYTDTDSLFVDKSAYDFINSSTGLIGNDLGNFHSDFANQESCAKKAIFFAKKIYCCKFENNTCAQRMKGVPRVSVQQVADRLSPREAKDTLINDEVGDGNIYKVFQQLLTGKTFQFDLCASGERVQFKFHKGSRVTSELQVLKSIGTNVIEE